MRGPEPCAPHAEVAVLDSRPVLAPHVLEDPRLLDVRGLVEQGAPGLTSAQRAQRANDPLDRATLEGLATLPRLDGAVEAHELGELGEGPVVPKLCDGVAGPPSERMHKDAVGEGGLVQANPRERVLHGLGLGRLSHALDDAVPELLLEVCLEVVGRRGPRDQVVGGARGPGEPQPLGLRVHRGDFLRLGVWFGGAVQGWSRRGRAAPRLLDGVGGRLARPE